MCLREHGDEGGHFVNLKIWDGLNRPSLKIGIMFNYEELGQNDLIHLLKPLIEKNVLFISSKTGKITYALKPAEQHDIPWCFPPGANHLHCWYYHRILFDHVSKRLPAQIRFVPSFCQECYKVVVRPETLVGLCELFRLQCRLEYPSKCGVEHRPYVAADYGGYFYCRGLEQGRERYEDVRAAVDEVPELGPDTEVTLKRGCTEMEAECGSSENWRVTENQLHWEALTERETDIKSIALTYPQPKSVITYIIRSQWFPFAHSRADFSYTRYTGGRLLFPPPTTYHDTGKEEEDGKV